MHANWIMVLADCRSAIDPNSTWCRGQHRRNSKERFLGRHDVTSLRVLVEYVISVLNLNEIIILWVYYTIPFGFSLFRHFWDITVKPLYLLCLNEAHWWWFSTRNVHMVHIVNPIRFKMAYTMYILVEVSFYIRTLNMWKKIMDWIQRNISALGQCWNADLTSYVHNVKESLLYGSTCSRKDILRYSVNNQFRIHTVM